MHKELQSYQVYDLRKIQWIETKSCSDKKPLSINNVNAFPLSNIEHITVDDTCDVLSDVGFIGDDDEGGSTFIFLSIYFVLFFFF